VLRGLLQRQADEIGARLPSGNGVVLAVRRVLASEVAGGDIRIEAVARRLGFSARTLQRRLTASGVSYQQLVDSARREAAARYLANSSLAIGEIAYLLGYSEPSAFHRAFKRWNGTTPHSLRRAHASR